LNLNLDEAAISDLFTPAVVSDQQSLHGENQRRVQEALKRYPIKFFDRFCFTGDDSQRMTQIALEEHFMNEKDPEQLRLFAISLINSAY